MRAEKRAPGGRPLTTGGMPSALRMAAIVDRATRWPTFFSAPCIGVYPQRGFSLAIRTARCRISASTPGRPRRYVSQHGASECAARVFGHYGLKLTKPHGHAVI